ncbi:glycosyltransferase [Brunnivagina elsteri]|uniref:Glycosyltransferase n=1 Tax=Brunnivagina elsteri CCALA 953 TaxID=987040 RepID=A0A2A2TQL6_9CYAN|nr:glycosyltransferase [Calothrix elsteri]PAX60723.1 glycosyltransferase [Calothrix elsteri CCALA 953]
MRSLYFLLPGTDAKFACGGLFAELKTMNIAQQICDAEVVTYRQREDGKLFLDDILKQPDVDLTQIIFVMSWGFDVAKLAAKLKAYNTVYHAHSAGYGFKLPNSVPIITVSRNTMGYWGQLSPHSLIYYLPNEISNQFVNLNSQNFTGGCISSQDFAAYRDIDVLVHTRKSSQYLMEELIPTLQQKCNVFVIDSFIDDLTALFNRAKVYLYDSAEYWTLQGVTEGFGLQPMEALACGCQVFSSVNHGLSDYLDPGFNCYKIAGYAKEYDIQRILKVVSSFESVGLSEDVLANHRIPNITKRLAVILNELNEFFDYKQQHQGDIQDLDTVHLLKLNIHMIVGKVKQKYFK